MAKLRKTPTEIKYAQLCRQLAKAKPKPKKKAKAKSKGLFLTRIEHRKNMPYKEFLKTSYWKNVREKVLLRDGKRCIICGYDKYLQVHHDHYKNHGDEMNHLEDLMTLCRKCHKEHHYAQV